MAIEDQSQLQKMSVLREKRLHPPFNRTVHIELRKKQETKDISKQESNPNQQQLVVKISNFKHFHNFSSLSSDVRNYQPKGQWTDMVEPLMLT